MFALEMHYMLLPQIIGQHPLVSRSKVKYKIQNKHYETFIFNINKKVMSIAGL